MPDPSASAVAGPNAAAVARLSGKAIAPTDLDSAEIAGLPLAIRDRSFFSAKVFQAKTLGSMKSKLIDLLEMDPEKIWLGRAGFIADMRIELGADPGDSGRLTDTTSLNRLGLIHDMQVEDAFSQARWSAGQDPAILDRFPCQELIRGRDAENPRDWKARFVAAGGKLSRSGRMIARKDDRVWTRISRFGNPWTPFDYGSGMELIDIDRDEAVAEGVIAPDVTVKPQTAARAREVEMSLRNISDTERDLLKDMFPAAVFEGGKVTYTPPGTTPHTS
ncbi:hypothetical protein OPIT5_29315 [Opitutaceae bacterium TAV5]|nr:hypothetical protein OPIT5_21805 [Opitutaceae bacterium TAV5]AHF94887.1 hypothetical protein OPIT5_29315 [Opitutaceae bacterium TAV5]